MPISDDQTSNLTEAENVQEAKQAQAKAEPPSIDNASNAGDDRRMEERIAKLEATVEYVQRDIKELKEDVRAARNDISGIRTTDFRLIFGAIIAVALGLAGLIAKGFHWI